MQEKNLSYHSLNSFFCLTLVIHMLPTCPHLRCWVPFGVFDPVRSAWPSQPLFGQKNALCVLQIPFVTVPSRKRPPSWCCIWLYCKWRSFLFFLNLKDNGWSVRFGLTASGRAQPHHLWQNPVSVIAVALVLLKIRQLLSTGLQHMGVLIPWESDENSRLPQSPRSRDAANVCRNKHNFICRWAPRLREIEMHWWRKCQANFRLTWEPRKMESKRNNQYFPLAVFWNTRDCLL